MVRIITEVSKYLIIFFMVLYTIKCFTVLKPVKEKKKRRALNVQIFYVFMIHFLCYLTMYLHYKTVDIIIFYILQMIISILYMVSYHAIYKKSSRLITNNMSFLLLIGYVMLTRLDFDMAKKQFLFASIMLGITAFIPLFIVKCPKIKNWNVFYAIFGICLLITVFIPGIGVEIYGSYNWIQIGSFSMQPMEIVKIIFVFFLASSFEKSKGFADMIKISIVSGIFMLILVLEKDLGGAVIFFMVFVMMVYLATGKHSILIGGVVAGSLLVAVGYILFKDKFSHVTTRINAWIDPFAYIDGDGYQVSQSLFAIGSGGFDGTGLCQGLPTSIPVVSSDFIFAAICEELGVIFGLCLLLMYISCFIYFINISMKIRNTFYKNVAFGFTICFIFQVFLNVGGVTKFIPSTGVTLPLVSYGVSSVVSTLVIFAIIQGICVLENSDINKNNNIERSYNKNNVKEKNIGKSKYRDEFSGE
ncbi:MAG: FtsW/RodA/SpoVE family cell cycle protein [Coprococcus sp.]|nr:FtsW/RodA/SpoVE family cell cycle protein [Coprococcus sp.]